ncbi:sucrose synthase (sucrose-UDP glucosyltransferase) [Subtercola boreus]|uniref:Sucrose synthase (Sucrose-UDP glucosyltransferase) n=1 Tax=Subtercola boreus TaxID=120213 RepID=A0A3E0VMS9_9MICO|nr:glycosyltransferase [Subtercola boreus]RFA10985.1 sucrose synthase (sucrose-UDP glucosyltransferase) [Subtercola boreus]TQL55416.1 glycosyltransferase involved in cell wall biosynthesis [Subtercola boreus]
MDLEQTLLDQTLARLHETPFILDVLRSADGLADAVDRFGDDSVPALVRLIAEEADDSLTAITAVHALARIYDEEAELALSELLSSDRAYLREHAAWAFWTRLPRLDAVSRLVRGVIGGGFTGALAERTLQQWALTAPDHIALALEGALAGGAPADARARLAETLGLIPGSVAGRALCALAADAQEPEVVRVAAMAALGDRSSDARALALVQEYAEQPGLLGDVARLAAYDIELALDPAGPWASVSPARPTGTGLAGRKGLTVAQLFLHADIDRGLTRAGAGDNGGIATLLVRLGDSLLAEPGIDRVITLSRGSAAASLAVLPGAHTWLSDGQDADGDARHILAPVPLLAEATSTASAWPARVAAERGIRRALLALGPVDVLHLRMADVGSMAAATVAARLGIPVVFTLAPDPHGVIHALDMAGTLTRASFGTVDEHEHYWFRTRLVQRLAEQAVHTVLFPRPDLRNDLRELLGIDIDGEPGRFTVVPEGIDVSVIETASREARERAQGSSGAAASTAPFEQLDELVAALPPHRHGLPLAITVGRLHHVKGMATIVEAWAADPALRTASNLIIVGGDLGHPSADEQGQLDRIERTLLEHPEARDGLILAGHRPNDVVARWLGVARFGSAPTAGGPLVAPRGVYVCGSLKEEFGIALLEALAAGLIVIAPNGGGPATYIADGITGFLVDTRSADGIRAGLHGACELAAAPGEADDARISRAQHLVHSEFTVSAMAHALTAVYSEVAGRSHESAVTEYAP